MIRTNRKEGGEGREEENKCHLGIGYARQKGKIERVGKRGKKSVKLKKTDGRKKTRRWQKTIKNIKPDREGTGGEKATPKRNVKSRKRKENPEKGGGRYGRPWRQHHRAALTKSLKKENTLRVENDRIQTAKRGTRGELHLGSAEKKRAR